MGGMTFVTVPSLRPETLNLNLHLQLGQSPTRCPAWVAGCVAPGITWVSGLRVHLQGIVSDPAEGVSMVRSQLWEPWMSTGAPGIHPAQEVITNAVEEASRQEWQSRVRCPG